MKRSVLELDVMEAVKNLEELIRSDKKYLKDEDTLIQECNIHPEIQAIPFYPANVKVAVSILLWHTSKMHPWYIITCIHNPVKDAYTWDLVKIA